MSSLTQKVNRCVFQLCFLQKFVNVSSFRNLYLSVSRGCKFFGIQNKVRKNYFPLFWTTYLNFQMKRAEWHLQPSGVKVRVMRGVRHSTQVACACALRQTKQWSQLYSGMCPCTAVSWSAMPGLWTRMQIWSKKLYSTMPTPRGVRWDTAGPCLWSHVSRSHL